MVARAILSAAALAGVAFASPIERRQNIDPTVLALALNLEHLENAFYKGALKNFTEQDFERAGYSANYYNNLKYIASDEQSHVELLTSALSAAGASPDAACTYNFPYTDVPSFITLSSVLEGVGTSAYLGAAPLITSKQYLGVAGSILVTEALHTSYQRASVNEVPFADPYGTAIDPTSAYTLATLFIVSCPKSNAPLPFTAFPYLQVKGMTATQEEPESGPSNAIKRATAHADAHAYSGHGWPEEWQPNANSHMAPSAGESQTFTVAQGKTIPSGSYVTFVSGLNVISVPGTISGTEISATIPAASGGQTYVFVTKSSITTITDSQILYGPAILEVKPAAPMIDFSES